MARKAFVVVVSHVLFERLVRIMTSGAAYTAIARVALAEKHSIRLETNVVELHILERRELRRAAMARSAKLLRQLIAVQPPGVENDHCAAFASLNFGHVLAAWSMTSFTANSMHQRIEL